jgi:dTDP-4-amino-4,6-dideoxygalactose transaminase
MNSQGTRIEAHIETRVADLFGYSEAVLFGRARSGVAALLDVLDLGAGSPFVMPSNLCPDLFLAVQAGGARARLAPVSASNGLAPDEELAAAMQQEKRPGIVMPAHLYGFVQDYSHTLREAKARGCFVLENDTIATRARLDSSERGAFGDALLVSFGDAKAIEAGGGGAVLTDDAALARALRERVCDFPPLDAAARKAEHDFLLLGRQLRAGQGQGGLGDAERERLLLEHAPSCRHRFPEELQAPLLAALDAFPALVADRRRRVALWQRVLAPFSDVLFAAQAECIVPWRLTLRAPQVRNDLVAALRIEGIDAGTNFPPLTASFPVLLGDQRHDSAEQWAHEVLNLWLTPSYDEERIRRAAEIIGRSRARKGNA